MGRVGYGTLRTGVAAGVSAVLIASMAPGAAQALPTWTVPGPELEQAWEAGTAGTVYDGDTLLVDITSSSSAYTGTQKIRTIGINAPEVAHDSQAEQCGAAQAETALRRLAPRGTPLQLRALYDTSYDGDRGRVVRSIYAQDTEGNWFDTARQLVSDGQALWFPHKPTLADNPEWAHNLEYRVLADDAKAGSRGPLVRRVLRILAVGEPAGVGLMGPAQVGRRIREGLRLQRRLEFDLAGGLDHAGFRTQPLPVPGQCLRPGPGQHRDPAHERDERPCSRDLLPRRRQLVRQPACRQPALRRRLRVPDGRCRTVRDRQHARLVPLPVQPGRVRRSAGGRAQRRAADSGDLGQRAGAAQCSPAGGRDQWHGWFSECHLGGADVAGQLRWPH